jgi:hypothetical protein
MYQVNQYKITGASPLLMHNGQLADPLNEHAQAMKKISGKRDKTEADFAELARLEWFGGLYLEEGKPCLPGEVIEATFAMGSRKRKKGKQAQAGVFCDKNFPLLYNGSSDKKIDLQKMWESGEYRLSVPVVISRSRVIRTRPRFEEWSSLIELNFDDTMLNPTEVLDILKICGEQIGLCDWRPKFGRFIVEAVK